MHVIDRQGFVVDVICLPQLVEYILVPLSLLLTRVLSCSATQPTRLSRLAELDRYLGALAARLASIEGGWRSGGNMLGYSGGNSILTVFLHEYQ